MLAVSTDARLSGRAIRALAVSACALLGCSLPGPAGFWTSYRSDCIVGKSSDQGPWGGTRSIKWRASGAVRFSLQEAQVFAERHGWKHLDDFEFDPAAGERPAPKIEAFAQDRHGPRFLAIPSTVMRFDSGWTREDPGTNEMSTAIGYVQVARDGLSLYVFHFWGNG